MKKALLLSVVASGFIYAGGNIAPVAPVQQPTAAPAACDFYGGIGVRYDALDNKATGVKFDNKSNNIFAVAGVLGVKKELGAGFGLGAEVGGYTNLGTGTKLAGTPMSALLGGGGANEAMELSELYLTYKAGNTAFKVGRFALPKSLSPWAWTDSTAGVKDVTFEGALIVNTDLPDTTLVGGWVARAGSGNTFGKVNGLDNKGLFAVAVQNKSIKDTTLTLTGYYITQGSAPSSSYSVWGQAETKVSDFDLGLEVAYAKVASNSATTGVAGYIGTNVGGLDVKLTGAYINNGASTLNLTGDTAGFWGNTFDLTDQFGGDTTGATQTIGKLDVSYNLGDDLGTIYGVVAYDKTTAPGDTLGAGVGYNFKLGKVEANVEYRYKKVTGGLTTQRVIVQGAYKF